MGGPRFAALDRLVRALVFAARGTTHTSPAGKEKRASAHAEFLLRARGNISEFARNSRPGRFRAVQAGLGIINGVYIWSLFTFTFETPPYPRCEIRERDGGQWAFRPIHESVRRWCRYPYISILRDRSFFFRATFGLLIVIGVSGRRGAAREGKKRLDFYYELS